LTEVDLPHGRADGALDHIDGGFLPTDAWVQGLPHHGLVEVQFFADYLLEQLGAASPLRLRSRRRTPFVAFSSLVCVFEPFFRRWRPFL
jgi:hypothetical protein